MRASSVFINRPVFTIVLSIVIVVFGVIGFQSLPVREYPLAERPIISVQTRYPGANAAVVESQITEPLEEAINTVSGIVSMTSTSREGRSTIRVEFDINDDLDRAANDIRDRTSGALNRLPEDAEPPTVEKSDTDGDPIIYLNITSNKRSLLELSDIARDLVKPRVETIKGVSAVSIWGDKEYAMRLKMDVDRLAAYNITPTDVRSAIARANVELPSGRLEGDYIDVNIRTISRLGDDPEEFLDTVIKGTGKDVVRFRDIGTVSLEALNEKSILKVNGVPMVNVVLRPQSGANVIEIVDEFYNRLDQMTKDIPQGVETQVLYDTSQYIRASIDEVKSTIVMALVLVCLTIFFFLREWRSSIIPLVTIPISLIGGFFIMYIFGFSINVLTLLGMVLAVGLVVDDAVVVLENIYTKIEAGIEPKQAGIEGIKEIFLAVIATTLALVSVFMPIIFLGGLTGVLFREFGVTLAGIVVISSFVALTLTPMMSSRILKQRRVQPWLYRKTEPFFAFLNNIYKDSLRAFLNVKWLALPVVAGCFVLAYVIFNLLPSELAPKEDRGSLFLNATGPQGANFDYMSDIMNEVDERLKNAVPEMVGNLTLTSPGFGSSSTANSGFSRVFLTAAKDRDRSQTEIVGVLRKEMNDIPGAEISIREPETLSVGGRGQPVQYVVQNQDFSKIENALPAFLEKARQRPEFSFVEVDLKFNQPEIRVHLDRNRAESLGVRVSDVAETIQAALAGQRYGYFIKDGRQYEIIGEIKRADRNEPLDLSRLTVNSSTGAVITLDNLATFEEVSTAPLLYRYNRFASARFSASLNDGYTIGNGIEAMNKVAEEVLDETFATDLAGQSREFRDAGSSLLFVFIMALTLVYLVLAAQFESFRDPTIIMLTVPLALVGGLLSLWYFEQTLNIFSQIGLIMLIGLVTKNGILLVEFANQRRGKSKDLREAVEFAAAARFRPILMTSISTILGTLPIALALGAGAESRVPLGIAVIGGLIIGSFLTLYIIPAAYIYLASKSSGRDVES